MLAQNFKTAADLRLSELERDALITVLGMLERGELTHVPVRDLPSSADYKVGTFTGHFNMGEWEESYDCGTVCCIGGTAELIGGIGFNLSGNIPLSNLFYPAGNLDHITTDQAAKALRSFLSTGRARWRDAVRG